ncbi:Protein ImuA OS=Castellaniella defragrans OX=75697 GN=HNR28_001363 PE=4 SV=1 [Castellaniella defragrans]
MSRLRPELIHPTLWRASQLAMGYGRRLRSGYDSLDQALGGGWPLGALIELLPDRPGIGEVHLLRAALSGLAGRRQHIILLNPPYLPSLQCWTAWGLSPDNLILVQAGSPQDTAWAAAQILHYQSSAALLCWAQTMTYADLLTLHRLARRGATLAVLYRPAHTGRQDSPASLRIALQAAPQGLKVLFLKCPGPLPRAQDLALYPDDHALDQSAPAAAPGRLSRPASVPVAAHAPPDLA